MMLVQVSIGPTSESPGMDTVGTMYLRNTGQVMALADGTVSAEYEYVVRWRDMDDTPQVGEGVVWHHRGAGMWTLIGTVLESLPGENNDE